MSSKSYEGAVGRESLAKVILPEPNYVLGARSTFYAVSGSLYSGVNL